MDSRGIHLDSINASRPRSRLSLTKLNNTVEVIHLQPNKTTKPLTIYDHQGLIIWVYNLLFVNRKTDFRLLIFLPILGIQLLLIHPYRSRLDLKTFHSFLLHSGDVGQ